MKVAKSVLITGNEGYIGSNLYQHLRRQGFSVVGYDLKSGFDIRNRKSLQDKMKNCELVVHLAAKTGVMDCEKNKDEAYDVNIGGTRNVVDSADENGARVILASTFAAKNPRNTYGKTKQQAEKIVISRDGVVLRLSNVHGGKKYLELKNTVVAQCLRARDAELPIQLHGHGEQERDFIHVDDVCRAFIHSINIDSGIYEVSTGVQTSILEIVKIIGIDPIFGERRKGDVDSVPSDPANWMPGWSPTINLEEALKK